MKFKLFILCCLLPLFSYAAEGKDNTDSRRRAFIDNFISYYKSAYEREQIEFISDFFSNNALIITETKQLIKTGTEIAPKTSKARPYKLLIENRAEYIKRLRQCFAQNKKITLGISNVFIRQHPKYPEIYGVHFFQRWEDVGTVKNLENSMPGYIFLMIDFRKSEAEPIVHARTWQPQSNISKPSDKYTLTDFRIL